VPAMSDMSRDGDGRLRMGESQCRVGDDRGMGSRGGLFNSCLVGLILSYFCIGFG
jgi:hypothetical protein